jgi:hypothetical protein
MAPKNLSGENKNTNLLSAYQSWKKQGLFGGRIERLDAARFTASNSDSRNEALSG